MRVAVRGVLAGRLDIQHELPGPGNYFKPSTLERRAETCGSVSKKGYGVGFVSKVSSRTVLFSNWFLRCFPPLPGMAVDFWRCPRVCGGGGEDDGGEDDGGWN